MSTPPSAAQGPDPGLLRAVQAGAPEAVDAWFQSEHPEVYRLCFGFLCHRADAEDVAQEAMLHLLDRLASWDSARSYRAWRTTLVLNRCRDRVQGAWRGLEPPPVPAIPLTSARAARPDARRARIVRRALAAAAVLVIALGASALWRARRAEPRPARVAQRPGGASPGGVEVLAAFPDRIELRSGPVRLLLLDPPPAQPTDNRPGS